MIRFWPQFVFCCLFGSRWKKVQPLVKSYLGNTLHLLIHLTDSVALTFVLRRIRAGTVFMASFNTMRRRYLKQALKVFSAADNAPRIQAFLLIREMGISLPPPALEDCFKVAVVLRAVFALLACGNICGHSSNLIGIAFCTTTFGHLVMARAWLQARLFAILWCLKLSQVKCLGNVQGSYRSFSSNAKFMTPTAAPHVEFMAACVVELSRVDVSVTYERAFGSIRQLALLLRVSAEHQDKGRIQAGSHARSDVEVNAF